MKPLLCLIFFAHIFLVRADNVTHDPLKYVPLLMKIRERYAASTLFLLHPAEEYGEYGDLGPTYIIHTWIRYFGDKGIAATSVHSKRMFRMARYFHKIIKPLIVVLISGPYAFVEFSEATKSFKMNFATWILLFLSKPENGAHDHCHQPLGNPLNVALNTEMLVLCPGDPIIREWYSVNGTGTTVFNLAAWDPSTEKILFLTDANLYERRRNLQGMILRGVSVAESIIFKVIDGKFEGYFGKIVNELIEIMNFTIDIVAVPPDYGTFNTTSKMFSGAVGMVVSGQADIGLSGFSMTNERLQYVDYLIPLILSKSCLYIMEPEMFAVQWYAFFQTFDYSIWLAIVIMAVLCVIFLIVIKIIICPDNPIRVIYEDFFNVWGILCQQGLTELPENTSLRIVYFSILCTAFVIFAAYSASLISSLTACIRVLPFSTLEEFIQDGTYSLIVTKESSDYDLFANSKNSFSKSMMKLMKPYHLLPHSVSEGYRQICKDPTVAFYVSEEIRKGLGFHIPCKVSSISAGRVDSLSIILPKDSPYTSIFNYHLHRFLNSGVLYRVRANTLTMDFDKDIMFQPVRFASIASVVAIFAGGVVLAAITLAIEIYTFKRKYSMKFLTSIINRSPS